MALEQDRSGLMIYSVLDQSPTLATVIMMAGAHTTVIIPRTFPSSAILARLMVSDDSSTIRLMPTNLFLFI